MKNPSVEDRASDLPWLSTPAGRTRLLDCYRLVYWRIHLRFGFPRSSIQSTMGFLHYRDRDGSQLDDDKSIWAQGRMSWMLLTLYNQYQPRPEWLAWAESGLRFLERHGFADNGRMFFHVARDGQPLRQRRYAYSEAFAAIRFRRALQSDWQRTFAPASHRSVPALHALEFYSRLDATQVHRRAADDRAWRPRMITIVTAQELRHNLPSEVGPLCNQWIDRAIEEIDRLFVNRQHAAVLEAVAPDGTVVDHVDGRALNPGHAIEGAWFILHEGELRGDARLIELGCQMIDWMWQRGWDAQYGGLLYFCDLFGKPPQEYWHDMKFWWPHNEAIIATLMAYRLTGQSHYAQWHQQLHDWSYTHFADPEYGEWFGYLHRDGSRASTTKGNLWKSCFHLPRMQWICWQQLNSWTPKPADISDVQVLKKEF